MLPSNLAKSCLAAFLSRVATQTPSSVSHGTQLMSLNGFSRGCHQSIPILNQARSYATTAAIGSGKRKAWLREAKGWSKIFQQLSKARLSALVVSTAAVGYVAGEFSIYHLHTELFPASHSLLHLKASKAGVQFPRDLKEQLRASQKVKLVPTRFGVVKAKCDFTMANLVAKYGRSVQCAGSGERIEWAGLWWTAAGTFGAAACANTLNQIYEVANDAKMRRTMMRPLPLGKITVLQALAFAGVMGAGGTAILAEKANPMTACMGMANIVLYAGIYTPLKVVSAANTWVGALVGGIPPLMGWTAASGSLEPGAFVLAAALYFWQLPHFLSLAWLHREDYMRGEFAMLSRFDPLGKRSAACALRNSLYMLPLGAIAVWVGTASMAFAYEATIAAGTLASTAAVFFQKPSQRSARMLFRFSILFLPFFMAGLVLHRSPNTHTITFESLRRKLSEGVSLSQGAVDRELGSGWSLQEISAVPLPFLPVPVQLQPSAKLPCEGESPQDGSEGSLKGL